MAKDGAKKTNAPTKAAAEQGDGDPNAVRSATGRIRADESRALKVTDAEFFKRAIILTGRTSVRNAVAQSLEALQAKGVQVATSPEECLELCLKSPTTALIADLNLGAKVVFPMLKRVTVDEDGTERPILLIVQNVSPEIAVAALEYRVGKVMTGHVTPDRLKSQLLQLKSEVTQNFALRRNLTEARAARESGDSERAVTILESLRESLPGNAMVITELAELRIEQEHWTEAEMLLHPLWSAEPPYIRALSGYSRCLMVKGSFDDAIAVLKRAKIMNPFEGERLVALGNLLLEVGKSIEAEDNFTAALELDPGDRNALLGMSKVKLLEEDVNAGLSILKEIASKRELASVFNAAAIIAIRQERFEHGRELYRSAIVIMRGDKPILARLVFNLGVAYFKWKMPSEAGQCFKESAKLDSKFTKAKQNVAAMRKTKGAATVNLAPQEITEDFAEESVSHRAKPGAPKKAS